MSSFSEFYKKWKEDNGVTTETSYRNLSDSEKAQEAIQSIDRTFEEFKRTPIANKSTSEEILSPANNKLGLLFNNSKTDKKETLLTAKNKGMLETTKKEEDNSKGILETIYKKKNIKSSTGTKYGLGNIDLTNRPVVKNEDGSISTVRSMSFQDENGKEVLIPTVVDRKVVSDDEAIQHYYQTGEYLGKFDTVEEANSYAELLHKQQESMYSNKNSSMILFANQDKTNMYEQNVSNMKNETTEKNNNVWEDILGIGKITRLGVTSGGKEVLNYIESTTENNNPQYSKLKERQFLASPNVSVEDKASYNSGEEIETNLVKKAIRDSILKDEQLIQEEQSKLKYNASQKIGEIAPSIGQMIPGTAISTINPYLGTMYFTTSAGGSYINDALDRGMNEKEAWKYGTIMGALEGASESIITGQQLSKINKAFTEKVISKNILDSYGFNIFENAVQEAVMEPAQEIVAGITGGNEKADWTDMRNRIIESGFNGALMGAIVNGVTYGLEKSGRVYNKIKNGENVTKTEYKEALQENINKFGQKIVENAMKKGATEVYTEVQNINNSLNTQEQTTTQNETDLLQGQQVTQEENKIAQNTNIEQAPSDTRREEINRKIAELEKTAKDLTYLEKRPYLAEIRSLKEQINALDGIGKVNQNKNYKTKQVEVVESNQTKNVQNNFKQQQLNIINRSNPAPDDTHTWIRDVKDIKTFEEAFFEDGEYSGMDPDFTEEMANQAKETGKITVYSSYPIENGTFVSPSQMEASQYAGGDSNKLYSKEVDINDVAWIDGAEGQYAKIEGIANNQQTVYNNTESEGGINEEQSIKSTEQNQINQRNDRRRVQGLLELYQAGETNGTASSEKLYGIKRQEEVTEQRVKETLIDYANKYNKKSLNENETKLKNIINKLGGDVVFYEYGQENYFQGLANKDKFYIDTLGENKIENVFYHELTHFLRQQNNEIYKNEIQPIVNEIASDYDYQEAIFNYANSASENFDIRDLNGTKQSILAEEVVADQIASFYGDLEANYGLSNEIKVKLKKSMDKILLQDNIAPIVENLQTNKRIPNEITEGEVIPLGEKATEERVAKILEQSPEKVEEKDRKWAIFKANIFDKGIVFEELSRKANNRELQAKWDYTLTSTARGQNAIGMPRYEFDSETKEQKQISKSLEEIREEVGDKRTDFSEYMYHQLNIDRMTLVDRFGGDTGTNYERKNPIKNKPVFADSVTAEISQKIVDKYEQSNPEFKEWAKDVYDFLDANTKELVKNGVISEDTRQLFKEMYPHYVPISRVDNKGNAIAVPLDTGRTGINSPIKRAKGGNRDIKPLFETIADRTLQTYRASARNSLGIELKNTLQQLNEYQLDNLQQTDIDTTLYEIGDAESTDSLLQKGKGGNNPTFTIFEDGEKVTFDISKDVYDALKPMSDSSILSKNSKILNKISNLRRGVLTEYNPLFLITNSIKDAQDVLMNSQHSAKTYSKFPEAYAQIVKKGFWYNEYVQNGGEQNSYFKDGKFESDTKAPTSKKIITLPLKSISNINNMIEMAPRLAEYIASREDGRSVETSMLDASRVTTNFKAGGDIVKWANRNGATFLNASVQGAVQAVRNIQEANAKGLKGWAVLTCKTAIAGLPTILLNNLLWDDDDDYAELQDYVKDSYYCIAKYGDGKFIRIPKGRTVATIQKIVSNINEYITEDKEINIDNLAKDFWEDITFAGDNLAPNNPIDNNVISPIIQAITNTSWYGEDIVPTRLQNKPKVEQYDETTDSFSIWLGEKLNQSPYKINYLIDQYSGGLGDVLLPMLTKQAESNMIEDKFTTDSTMKSKYPGEFFEKIDELEINSNSSNATDKDILKYKYMSNVSSDMSELYAKKREIQNSSSSDEMKKKQLKDVQKQINTLAKDALENVEKTKSTSTTATIGNNEYYKYNGEWKQLSEEEVEKNQNISLKTYANYKNQIYNETQSKRKSGELTEQQSLKTNDKIGILLKSNYSDEEKEAIYENYIKTNSSSDTLSTYDIMKSTNINIDEYLRYEQQEFKSDNYDDGTLTGKTVSGSKKDKVINYLNSMNITGNQRLLLYASNGYSTTRSEKEQLVKYVQQLDLTKEEKLKLYDKFSGFTVYKNGEVRYK